MNFFAAFFVMVWSMESTLCRPSAKDIPRYVIGENTFTMEELPYMISGKCKLYKAHMVFGKNKVEADFCGGSCDAKGNRCIACQPTANPANAVILPAKSPVATINTNLDLFK